MDYFEGEKNSMILPTINNRPFHQKLAYVLIIIITAGYLCILGKEVICPLIFGLLFSILLLPMATFFEKKLKFNRSGAAGLSVLVLLLLISGIFLLIGSQISSLTNDLPLLKEQVAISLKDFQQWISSKFNVNIEKQMAFLDSAALSIQSASPSVIGATVLSISAVMMFLIFVTLDTFFLLLYRKLLVNFLLDLFKEKNAAIVHEVIERVQYITRKYLVGLLLQMITVSLVCCIVFMMLGIKYAILLGLITGLFNVVPYIGIFSALLLNILITFATTGLLFKVFLVVTTVVVMHVIDSNILLPLIVGSKVRINAFITLLGVVVGELVWGIPGMFLSIPIIAITKIIFDRVEGLKPWGRLMGDEKDGLEVQPKKIQQKTALDFPENCS